MSKHAMTSTQASKVKRKGHAREEVFNEKFGNPNFQVNYSGASNDNIVDKNNKFYKKIIESLNVKSSDDLKISLKSSNTIQIHLGNIPELTDKNKYVISQTNEGHTKVNHMIDFGEQVKALKSKTFWYKYLAGLKGEVLCYTDDITHKFFNMDDVINFITNECKWRILSTGRLKGDFSQGNKNKQFLTYEYRKRKKTFVIGAHGGKKGKEFIQLLEQNLPHVTI